MTKSVTQYKICKHHGKTSHARESNSDRFRCRQCRVVAVTKRRRNVKLKLIQAFGGKCIICKYDKCVSALHFHHVDPKNKNFGIGNKGLTISYDKLLIEAKNVY
jgi:hypothetical protein